MVEINFRGLSRPRYILACFPTRLFSRHLFPRLETDDSGILPEFQPSLPPPIPPDRWTHQIKRAARIAENCQIFETDIAAAIFANERFNPIDWNKIHHFQSYFKAV